MFGELNTYTTLRVWPPAFFSLFTHYHPRICFWGDSIIKKNLSVAPSIIVFYCRPLIPGIVFYYGGRIAGIVFYYGCMLDIIFFFIFITPEIVFYYGGDITAPDKYSLTVIKIVVYFVVKRLRWRVFPVFLDVFAPLCLILILIYRVLATFLVKIGGIV